MATLTPNLNLKKPAGTDYVRIGDFNDNANVLDAAVGSLGQLQTAQKTNLVLAINEAAQSGGTNGPYIDETTKHWMVWSVVTGQYVDTGIDATGLEGPKGEKGDKGNKGDAGTGIDIRGTYATVAALEAAVPTPTQGDMYNVGTAAPYNIYMWDETVPPGVWVDQGVLQGPAGQDGANGQDGADGADGQDGVDGTDGAPGPNEITTNTASSITGLLKGAAGKVAQAVEGTDYEAPPTINVNTDAAPSLGTITHNNEYRCTNGSITTAPSFAIAAVSSTSSRFYAAVVYKSPNTTASIVVNNSGYTMKWQGLDVSSGTFAPKAGTVYRLSILFDGIYLNIYVSGVA